MGKLLFKLSYIDPADHVERLYSNGSDSIVLLEGNAS